MRRIRNFVIIVVTIICCVLANKQIWAQNNFNGYVVNPQNNTYNQTPQNHIVQASQISRHDNGSPITPTVYQAAATTINNIPANNTQPTHLSTLYLPAKPDQAAPAPVVAPNSIPAPPPIPIPTIRPHGQNATAGQTATGQTAPQNNALPYSPFPVAKPIPFPTPTPFPAPSSFPAQQNVGLNQNQNSGLNNTNNNFRNDSAITTVGFVAPDVPANNSPTEPSPQISNAPQPLNERNLQNGAATASFPAAANGGGYNPNSTVRNVAVANNPVAKSHKLQHLTGAEFETKLVNKLGKRFVAVRNVGNSNEMSRYKLPVKDGSSVDLTIERVNGIVTLTGSGATVDNCVKIVRLLDLPESRDGSVTEFMLLENANSGALRQAANLINQSAGQNQSAQNTVRLVQNQPNTTPETRANPNTPNTANPNTANPNTANNDQIKKEELPSFPANDLTNGGNGTILGPVQVSIVEGADVFVVTGQSRDVAIVENIIAQIDKISLEYEPAIELVPLRQADSYRVSSIVQQLYSQIYAQRRGTITMIPLVKPNTILMVGKKENLDIAKELVGKLDSPVDPKSQFKIFHLKNAQAATLQEQINSFYQNRPITGYLEQQVFVLADARINSLIVLANPRDLVEVENMIKQLDVEGGETKSLVRTFFLKNAVASELAQTLQTAISGTTGAGMGNYGYSSNTNQQSRNPVVSIQDDKNNGLTKPVSTLYDIRIAADVRSNTIIVTAPLDTMRLIEILIRQLDQHPSAESVIKIFTLVNADAYTVTTMLQSLFSSTSTTGGGGGFGGTGGSTNSNMMTTRRPGIEQDESTLVSIRFVAEVRTNSIIAIGSAGDMTTVETILMRLDEENMNNRKVMTIKLVNTPASDIATVIQNYVRDERTLEIQNITSYMPLSPKEQYLKEVIVVPEPISNTLIISCTPRFYDQIRTIVHKLDERPRIVAIQALMAEISMNDSNERGFEIGLQDSILFSRSIGTDGPGFLFGDNATLPTGNVSAGTVASQGISQLGLGRTGSSGIGGFTFSASSESLSILMRALEEKDKLRILSRPQLTAMHNQRAIVQIGQKVPFVSTSGTTGYNNDPMFATSWEEVGTVLDLTPRITADDQIVMSVYVRRSSVGSEADGITTFVSNNVPIKTPKISKTEAQTTISAMDGQTIVIGGIITEQKEFVNRSVPGLNKIPLVKHFFEYESHRTTRSELLIILTPTIIRSDADMERLRQQEYSRMHWCLSDVIKLTGKSEMRTRTDQWAPCEVPHVQGTPTKLEESQLPPEENIKKLIPLKVREE